MGYNTSNKGKKIQRDQSKPPIVETSIQVSNSPQSEQNKLSAKDIREWVLFAISLVTFIIFIIIGSRTDSVYWFIPAVIILFGLFAFSLFSIFTKGKVEFEGKRLWTLSLCWVGITIGIIISFLIFKPNREYISYIINGTPTPTASPTVTPTMTLQDTSTIQLPTSSYTPTLTSTFAPTLTSTFTPTLTNTPLFKFAFTEQGYWNFDNADVTAENGEIRVSMACLLTPYCSDYQTLPSLTVENFAAEFSAKDNSDNIYNDVSLRFRIYNDFTYYQAIFYPRNGTYAISRVMSGNPAVDILAERPSTAINTGIGDTNIYRVSMVGDKISINVNGQDLVGVEDSSIKGESIGNISLGVGALKNYSAIIYFQYIMVDQR